MNTDIKNKVYYDTIESHLAEYRLSPGQLTIVPESQVPKTGFTPCRIFKPLNRKKIPFLPIFGNEFVQSSIWSAFVNVLSFRSFSRCDSFYLLG